LLKINSKTKQRKHTLLRNLRNVKLQKKQLNICKFEIFLLVE